MHAVVFNISSEEEGGVQVAELAVLDVLADGVLGDFGGHLRAGHERWVEGGGGFGYVSASATTHSTCTGMNAITT